MFWSLTSGIPDDHFRAHKSCAFLHKRKQNKAIALAFSVQAKFTDWETAAGRRIVVPNLAGRRVSRGQRDCSQELWPLGHGGGLHSYTYIHICICLLWHTAIAGQRPQVTTDCWLCEEPPLTGNRYNSHASNKRRTVDIVASCAVRVESIVEWLPRVEAGENISTVALRVVRATKKEPCARVYNWATLFLGKINTGAWTSKFGETQNRESEVWSWVPRDSDPRKTALARPSRKCKSQTGTVVREAAP
jgi:hypothetical protein